MVLTFKNGLEVGIHWLRNYSCHTKFVNVQTGSVSIIEDLGMTKSMNRWPLIYKLEGA